jgi:murein DD-endopeptidase MepM/ murein hydrolase activator NlpD
MKPPASISPDIARLNAAQGMQAQAQGLSARASTAADRRKAAQEFSSLLFLEVLKAMRAAAPDEGLDDNNSLSRDIFTSMMDSEVARVMAQRDTTRFTRIVEQSLDKAAEARHEAVSSAPAISGADATSVEPRRSQSAQSTAQKLASGPGVVSSRFGLRADPFTRQVKFHDGIDIAVPAGTAVKAAAGGRVVFSGTRPGYGNVVEIDHGDGWSSRYAHNAENLVTVGQQIEAGQTIASAGSTGRATGPHVHFEVRKGGKPVNPEALRTGVSKGLRLSSVV